MPNWWISSKWIPPVDDDYDDDEMFDRCNSDNESRDNDNENRDNDNEDRNNDDYDNNSNKNNGGNEGDNGESATAIIV